jgi:hypothetical protein
MKAISLMLLLGLGALPVHAGKKLVKPQVIKKQSPAKTVQKENKLLKELAQKKISPKALKGLKARILAMGPKAVPTLIQVMKGDKFPDRSRWIATFLLGRIMGKKSSAFIAKFGNHPKWMLRLASLKTLLALGEKKYKGVYARLLKDKAMIVRYQALENIKQMQISELAPYVWAMLYDKANYAVMKGKQKRTHIIKEIIRTVGDLKFKKAQDPMLTMIGKKKYQDVHEELDYALSKISGKASPKGNMDAKKYYWQRQALKTKTI